MTASPAPLALGIETSCDDTACAVLDGTGRVLASVVSSQLAAHQPYGGVVPEIASREHLANWPAVSREVFVRINANLEDMGLVAATRGPGLVGSLLVGLSLGKSIAFGLNLPFYAVHHLEGHLVSPFLETGLTSVPERFVGLVVSGGHSNLFAVESGSVRTLGEARDDAMGEVFDKVGKRLGLAYPQGPLVDALAERGDAKAHPFAIPSCGDSLDVSFSGLKSQALGEIEKLERREGSWHPEDGEAPPSVLNLLAGFRAAAVSQVLDRVARLHAREPIPLLAVSGGAAANRLLRRELETWCTANNVPLHLVPLKFSGDNAAMIAFAAQLRHLGILAGGADDLFLAEAESRIPSLTR